MSVFGTTKRIEFYNYWIGNSLKPGGAFPITFFELYADLNRGVRHVCIAILNFCLVINLERGAK